MQKILITTGGTGGHVIPAQIIKEHLDNDFKVFFYNYLTCMQLVSRVRRPAVTGPRPGTACQLNVIKSTCQANRRRIRAGNDVHHQSP